MKQRGQNHGGFLGLCGVASARREGNDLWTERPESASSTRATLPIECALVYGQMTERPERRLRVA